MLNVNKLFNENKLERSNSSHHSPSRKAFFNESMRKLRSSCREKAHSSNEIKPTLISDMKESGIFKKKRDIQKQAILSTVKLLDLNVKQPIPEESEADLEAEIELEEMNREIIEKNLKEVTKRKSIGRSKKVVYSAPAGAYWPDLSALSEIDEKIEKLTQNDDWFGSGDNVLIKNFSSNDKIVYENTDDTYDTIPNDGPVYQNSSASCQNLNPSTQEENLYENSEIYVNELVGYPSSSQSNQTSSQPLSSSSLLSQSSSNSIGSAFTRVIPENSISKKNREYFDLRKDSEFIKSSDANNNTNINEVDNGGFYDEAWDHKLQRKLGHKSSLVSITNRSSSKEETLSISNNEKQPIFQPVEEKVYEPPWDCSESSSHSIVNRISPIRLSFPKTELNGKLKNHICQHPPDSNDLSKPLNQEIWYHPEMTRNSAEAAIINEPDGTFLVRPSGTSPRDYSLTIKFGSILHMKIKKNDLSNHYILGEYSKPYPSIKKMIDHFTQCFVPVWESDPVPLKFPLKRKIM